MKEAASVLDVSASFVRMAFDCGRIQGFAFAGKAEKGEEQRYTRRISRESLMLYLCESANFDAEAIVDVYILAARPLAPETVEAILKRLSSMITIKRRVR